MRATRMTAFFLLVVAVASLARAQNTATAPPVSIAPEPPVPVAPSQASALGSPQACVRSFVVSMRANRTKEAVECLDLSQLSSEAAAAKGESYAALLYRLMLRMWEPEFSRVSSDPRASSPYMLGELIVAAGHRSFDRQQEDDIGRLQLARGDDGLWRFHANTIAALDQLWTTWMEEPQVDSTDTDPPPQTLELWIRERFPAEMQKTSFLLPHYQWICLAILIFVGLLADLVTRAILHFATRTFFQLRRVDSEFRHDKGRWKPVGLLAQALVWYLGTRALGLPPAVLAVLLVGLKFFAVVAAVWTTFRFIDLLAGYIHQRAALTETKFDDLLVPLVQRSLKTFAVCVGLLVCAEAFDLPLTGLLGGLGIGGAAIVFASKDAISNVFGSVTVLVDRPFEIGDWIVTDDVEGTVEVVGFRSTRIRTFYNSLVTLPNSRLTTAVVDNMGRRRFRRIKATLGLQYDTTPEQIDAFCEGVRELIRRHPFTRKDYYHVYLNGYGDSALEVMLYCFVECPDWSIELREKHRLLADILRLSQKLGISFAFPTQTVHLLANEERSRGAEEFDDPEETGRQAAASLVGPPSSKDELPGPVKF